MKESQNTQSASCFDSITSLPPSDYAIWMKADGSPTWAMDKLSVEHARR